MSKTAMLVIEDADAYMSMHIRSRFRKQRSEATMPGL